jgi:hypothetical protein
VAPDVLARRLKKFGGCVECAHIGRRLDRRIGAAAVRRTARFVQNNPGDDTGVTHEEEGTRSRRRADGMAHHKRRRPKGTWAGCRLCKPHEMSGWKKRVRLKGLRVPRLSAHTDDGTL